MVTPVPNAVSPMPNAASVPTLCDVTNTVGVLAPMPNASSVPVPNATSAGNNKRPSALYDVTNTVVSQSAEKHHQKKKRTGRKSKDEKESHEYMIKFRAIKFLLDSQCRTLWKVMRWISFINLWNNLSIQSIGWDTYQETWEEEIVASSPGQSKSFEANFCQKIMLNWMSSWRLLAPHLDQTSPTTLPAPLIFHNRWRLHKNKHAPPLIPIVFRRQQTLSIFQLPSEDPMMVPGQFLSTNASSPRILSDFSLSPGIPCHT